MALGGLAIFALAACGSRAGAHSGADMAMNCRQELAPPAATPLPRLQLFGNSGEHWAALGDGCTLPVGLREVGVQLHLPLAMTEADVLRRVQVKGLTPLRSEWLPDWNGRNLLQLSFPAGPAAQEWSVSLDRVPDERGRLVNLAVRLRRVVPAVLDVTLRQGDGRWRRPKEGEVLSIEPLTLRASFSAAVDQRAVEAAFWRRLKGLDPQESSRLQWRDAATLQIDFPRAPRHLELGLKEAYDANGLSIEGPALILRAGVPASLGALDLATGREEQLFPLPPEPLWVHLSPSGRWLAVGTEEEGTPEPVTAVWVVERSSGAMQRTPLVAASGWLRDDVLVGRQGDRLTLWDPTAQRALPAQELPLAETAAISPDGNRIAWLRSGPPPATPDTTVGADLLIYTPATQAARSYPDFIHRAFRGAQSGRDQSVHLAWSPDGSRIAALDTQLNKGDGTITLVALDLGSGKVMKLLPAQPGTALGIGLAYAPEGTHILVGDIVWDLTAGKRSLAVPGRTGAGLWSPDGRYLLSGGNWGPVYATEVTAGKRRDLGSGLLAGWLPDGRAAVVRMAQAGGGFQPLG